MALLSVVKCKGCKYLCIEQSAMRASLRGQTDWPLIGTLLTWNMEEEDENRSSALRLLLHFLMGSSGFSLSALNGKLEERRNYRNYGHLKP